MSSNAFRVLVVDGQPALVWGLSQFLRSAGYDVLEAGSGEQALHVLDYFAPHFVVSGWEMPELGGVELCRRIRARRPAEYVYVMLLTGGVSSQALIEALQAGADDFLSRPVVHGELLARLRAGARMLEYERRLRAQAGGDSLTGLPGQSALLEAIEQRCNQSNRPKSAWCCVLADVDSLRGINYAFGRPTGDRILQAVATHLREMCGESSPLHRLAADRFGTLLSNTSEADAVRWAEHGRRSLAQAALPTTENMPRLTISVGVAQFAAGMSSETLFAAAEQALAVAKQSGRNRVVGAAERAAVLAEGGDAAGTVDPLRTAVARDIMTSSVVSFQERETLGTAVEFMRRSRLPMVPVVDADGRLLGTVSESDLRARMKSETSSSRPLSEVISRTAPAQDEETTVQSLYDFFRGEQAGRVEIVSSGRPTGYVTRGSLAVLAENINLNSFTVPESLSDPVGSLVVADLAWVEEA